MRFTRPPAGWLPLAAIALTHAASGSTQTLPEVVVTATRVERPLADQTLGASPGSVMKIFLIQGTLIGLMGTLAGVIGGVLLAANVDVVVPFIESVLGFKFLAKDVYQISDLPSELRTSDVLVTAFFSFVVSMLATIYPSYRAARINPAEALRYE